MSDNDLAAWLRVLLDERERIAQEADALAPSPWRIEGRPCPNVLDCAGGTVVETESGFNPPEIPVQAHIVRHDPARVLAEVEATRAILDDHAPVKMTAGWGCPTDGVHGWCPTIRWLAHPLADQPGYLDVWKPWRP